MSLLALIPARGGSKEIFRKNILVGIGVKNFRIESKKDIYRKRSNIVIFNSTTYCNGFFNKRYFSIHCKSFNDTSGRICKKETSIRYVEYTDKCGYSVD